MNFNEIEVFLTIVETKSLAKASEKLFITQSNVSYKLNSLEQKLNAKLIYRSKGKKQIELTPKGEEFVSMAKRLISLYKEVDGWSLSRDHVQLKIGSVDSLNVYVFSDLYKTMSSPISPIKINVSTHWSQTVYNLLETYELDLGLILTPIKSSSLKLEPIFKERMVLISNPNFSDYGTHIHPNDLNQSKEVFANWGPEYMLWHSNYWDPGKYTSLTVDTGSLLAKCLDHDGAWSIVPISMARTFQKFQPINISEIVQPPPSRTCYMITHKHPKVSSQQSLDYFEKKLKKYITSSYLDISPILG